MAEAKLRTELKKLEKEKKKVEDSKPSKAAKYCLTVRDCKEKGKCEDAESCAALVKNNKKLLEEEGLLLRTEVSKTAAEVGEKQEEGTLESEYLDEAQLLGKKK